VNLTAQLKLEPTAEQAIALSQMLVASNAACDYISAAERTGRGIAVEELTGIRNRIRATRRQRGVLHSWAFAQLWAFLEYKAKRAGVRLVAVERRNSSRECSACGHTAKRNRPNQSTFRCAACGFAAHADTNAARVISGRAAVSGPNVAGCAAV